MKKSIVALFVFTVFMVVTTGCNKEEDTIAEVTVVTKTGTTVAGAKVRLFGQGTEDQAEVGDIRINRTEFTGANGSATFDFTDLYVPGQSGFAILNVEITVDQPGSTSQAIDGIFKIVEEETNRKTFILE